MVAITSVALIGLAALVVDLGNAFVQRRDIQAQADFSALAGGSALPGSKVETDLSVTRAAEYLNKNEYWNGLVSVAGLVDGDTSNGEAFFPEPDILRVVAPTARVNFGLASVLGAKQVDIAAEATVGAFSGGNVMPIYAFIGCDYGPQTILADSTDTYGRVPSTLLNPTDDNGAKVLKTVFDSQSPAHVPALPGQVLEIDGSSMNGTTHVGFFKADGTVVTAPALSETNSVVTVTVPAGVYDDESQWFVRVSKSGASGPWSSVDPAEIAAFGVGAAPVECDDDSSAGNFGMAVLPRPGDTSVGTAEQIFAKNVAVGPTVDLLPYPDDPALPPPVWKCNGMPHPPYIDPPNEDANCVDTKTGSPGTTTEAFVTGKASWGMPKGRLDADNSSRCGGSRVDSGISGKSINDDSLTCFFTSSSVTVEDISRSDYGDSGESSVLSSDIFSSPRFIWQPVYMKEPSPGGSDRYTVVDFRPGFITDQPLDATSANPQLEHSITNNGITVKTSGGNTRVETIRAILFDVDALPKTFDGQPVTPYLGVGTPIIRMIN